MNATELWQCAQRSAQWLVAQQEPDGHWRQIEQPVVDAYYKAAWALALLGAPAAAQRNLDYARQYLLQPNGDLLPRAHRWHREVHYPYANAYLVLGSMALGRYDVAQPVLHFLLGLQSVRSGAFASVTVNGHEWPRGDTMSTAAGGLATLAAGRCHVACRAAEWLTQLVQRQPAVEQCLYCTVDAEDALVTAFPEADAPWRVVRTDRPDQVWYAVGLPFVFLVKLAQATGSRQHLEMARWFLEWQTRCVNPWSGPSSGKAGWGCAELYRMTGEERLRGIALDIGNYIAQFQAPDGSFPCPPSTTFAADHVYTADDFDLTSEYTLWLGQIAANLLARGG